LADYRIFETAAFLDDLAEVPASQRERLAVKLAGYVYPFLRRAPRDHPQVRSLRNYQPETWRWRMGDWRAFYLIDDEARVVSMIALALRRDAYRK
jgi:mRNA interferase RelE/StbE